MRHILALLAISVSILVVYLLIVGRFLFLISSRYCL